jgi:hypothetical protein
VASAQAEVEEAGEQQVFVRLFQISGCCSAIQLISASRRKYSMVLSTAPV